MILHTFGVQVDSFTSGSRLSETKPGLSVGLGFRGSSA